MVHDYIEKWFDDGKIIDALKGEESFFIPNVTYRDAHDRTYIIERLKKWAGSKEQISQAYAAILAVFEEIESKEPPYESFQFLWEYMIAVRSPGDDKLLPKAECVALINGLIERHRQALNDSADMRDLLDHIKAEWPDQRIGEIRLKSD